MKCARGARQTGAGNGNMRAVLAKRGAGKKNARTLRVKRGRGLEMSALCVQKGEGGRGIEMHARRA